MFGGLGKRNDLLVPALIGLGLFAQNCEMNLANNTSILLILFLLLNEDECCDRRPRSFEEEICERLDRIECCACGHDRERRRENFVF